MSHPSAWPTPADFEEEEARVAYSEGAYERSVAAWERLYQFGRSTDDDGVAARGAAMVALFLLIESAVLSTVRGWLTRARRHIAALPEGETHAIVATVAGYERFLLETWASRVGSPPRPCGSGRRTRSCSHRSSAQC